MRAAKKRVAGLSIAQPHGASDSSTPSPREVHPPGPGSFNEGTATTVLVAFTAFLLLFLLSLNFTVTAIRAHRANPQPTDVAPFTAGRKAGPGDASASHLATRPADVSPTPSSSSSSSSGEETTAHVNSESVALMTTSSGSAVQDEHPLYRRVCGSPAVDGYAHLNITCLVHSPTQQWWLQWMKEGHTPRELVVHHEDASDYDGIAVRWGIGNVHPNWESCAEQCRNHVPTHNRGTFEVLYCNTFVFCNAPVCFEPDAHKHTQGSCWLKFQEAPGNPEVNMRGDLDAAYRKRHPTAPARVQWITGSLLPPGLALKNGTWSPRRYW